MSPALAVRLMGRPETNKGATRAAKEVERRIVILNKKLLSKRRESLLYNVNSEGKGMSRGATGQP